MDEAKIEELEFLIHDNCSKMISLQNFLKEYGFDDQVVVDLVVDYLDFLVEKQCYLVENLNFLLHSNND